MHPALAARLRSVRAAQMCGCLACMPCWWSRGAQRAQVDHLVILLAVCVAQRLNHRGHRRVGSSSYVTRRRWFVRTGLESASAYAQVRLKLS